MKMQNGFKDLTLFDLDGDSRLYVVDSINNLHRANTCDEPCGPILNTVECPSGAENIEASTKELLSDNKKEESEIAVDSTANGSRCSPSRLKKGLLLAVVMLLLMVSFVLAALAIIFIVRMDDQLDYILAKVTAEGKEMKEMKILMMNHLNFSNNSDVPGIFPNQRP
ncbi:leucine-rich single-pass membrane protein 1 isoform X3 [Amblyraja radiata]|nr:leucine-rich single-pass membrane protein 1 isoform X3 [Amblyraja radiata]